MKEKTRKEIFKNKRKSGKGMWPEPSYSLNPRF